MNRFSSLRIRMMLLFCAVVGVFLAGTLFVLYGMFSKEIESQTDCRLRKVGTMIIASLTSGVNPPSLTDIDAPKEYFEILDPKGRVLQLSTNLAGHRLDLGGPLNLSEEDYRTIDTPELGDERLTSIPFRQKGQQRIMIVSMAIAHNELALAAFRQVSMWLLPVSLLVTAVISVWYVGRSLRPIRDLTEQATRMIEVINGPQPREFALQRSLEIEMPISSKADEVGRLASAYNLFFRRLGIALDEHRRFVSDASHELRTPLHILRGETELLLSRRRTVPEYEHTLQIINDELRTMSSIVDGLLTLSMADAGQLKPNSEPVYLNEVVEQACMKIKPLSSAKQIRLTYDADHDLACLGDSILLQGLCVIFLDNAVKYSPPGTEVAINFLQEKDKVAIEFRDQGYGIAPEDLPHIFDRFYRGRHGIAQEDSRSGGLGLAIAKAITHALSGRIDCESVLGEYTKFTVTLSAADSSPELVGSLNKAVA